MLHRRRLFNDVSLATLNVIRDVDRSGQTIRSSLCRVPAIRVLLEYMNLVRLCRMKPDTSSVQFGGGEVAQSCEFGYLWYGVNGGEVHLVIVISPCYVVRRLQIAKRAGKYIWRKSGMQKFDPSCRVRTELQLWCTKCRIGGRICRTLLCEHFFIGSKKKLEHHLLLENTTSRATID